MPCIGWTNINISFVFEVGVLLEDRSKVERANMVGLRWNKLNQSFNTTSYVKKLHQRFTYHHYHQYHKFLLIIIMTGGPYCIFLIINLTKSLTSIQTIWFAESLHYLPKDENEFSLFFLLLLTWIYLNLLRRAYPRNAPRPRPPLEDSSTNLVNFPSTPSTPTNLIDLQDCFFNCSSQIFTRKTPKNFRFVTHFQSAIRYLQNQVNFMQWQPQPEIRARLINHGGGVINKAQNARMSGP